MRQKHNRPSQTIFSCDYGDGWGSMSARMQSVNAMGLRKRPTI